MKGRRAKYESFYRATKTSTDDIFESFKMISESQDCDRFLNCVSVNSTFVTAERRPESLSPDLNVKEFFEVLGD